jgi:small-conductance mechanosensitive channel
VDLLIARGASLTVRDVRFNSTVAYGSDVDRVVEILDQVAHESQGVCRDPAPRVRMRGFGDSSLDFEVLCWVDHPSERGLFTHGLFMDIYKALARAGIEIPFPQRDVWVRAVPEPAAAAAPLDPPGGRASAQP